MTDAVVNFVVVAVVAVRRMTGSVLRAHGNV
jgi:hypothetical protein